MIKTVTKILNVVGYISIVIGIITFYNDSVVYAVSVGGAHILTGFMCLFLCNSINRITALEDKLGKYSLIPNDEKEPQIRCEKCNRFYYVDVPECPYCKVNDWENYIKYSKKD